MVAKQRKRHGWRFQDLTGKCFGKLTVISEAGRTKNGRATWNCLCACGNKTVVPGSTLIVGNTKTCGCGKWRGRHRLSLEQRLMLEVQITEDCWLWTGDRLRNGYGRLSIRCKPFLVHRLAYELFVGPIPKGLFVCHRCDVKNCVRPDHLFAASARENSLDASRKDRMHHPYGELQGGHKLTNDVVSTIRKRYAAGEANMRELASEYGVGPQAICNVIHRKTWKHI
jgi:HNH endonuclease